MMASLLILGIINIGLLISSAVYWSRWPWLVIVAIVGACVSIVLLMRQQGIPFEIERSKEHAFVRSKITSLNPITIQYQTGEPHLILDKDVINYCISRGEESSPENLPVLEIITSHKDFIDKNSSKIKDKEEIMALLCTKFIKKAMEEYGNEQKTTRSALEKVIFKAYVKIYAAQNRPEIHFGILKIDKDNFNLILEYYHAHGQIDKPIEFLKNPNKKLVNHYKAEFRRTLENPHVDLVDLNKDKYSEFLKEVGN